MTYGARAQRKPALGGSGLADIDIYKVLLLGKTERGIVYANGLPVVHDEIYSMNDFYPRCGGFNTSYYAAYVAQSFFDELERSINCEMKVLSYVDAAATQATYSILDEGGIKIFDIKAGRLGLSDKSAFGNKIGIKISHVEEITMTMTGDLSIGAVSAILDSVDNLKVGYYVKFVEGSVEQVRKILTVTPSTKTITFKDISGSGGSLASASASASSSASVSPSVSPSAEDVVFSSAGTTIYRLDWKLEVAVKDELGDYQKQEDREFPFSNSNTVGMADEVNDTESGSNYVILAVNTANTSWPRDIMPAALTSWTAFSGGADGTAATDSIWNTLATTYLEDTEHTILLAPESTSITHNGNMITFTTDGYKSMYYAQAANEANEATLKNFGASLRGSIKFGMLPSDKWLKVNDPLASGGFKEIPKVGVDAAFWFNTYYKFGEAKVAAGNKSEMVLKTTGKLVDTNGLVHDDSSGVGGRLIRNYSVNICRYRRGIGITNNSARTFSTDDGYKYQHQIMMWLLYSRSIVEYLRTVEQDPAGRVAQLSHYNVVWAYMRNKYKAGFLYQGQKEDGSNTTFEDVCIIVNDFTINTLANINNGIEETFMQFVAPAVIEEPILSLASAGVTTVRR